MDKMRHKKRSGIDDDAQKVITDFLDEGSRRHHDRVKELEGEIKKSLPSVFGGSRIGLRNANARPSQTVPRRQESAGRIRESAMTPARLT